MVWNVYSLLVLGFIALMYVVNTGLAILNLSYRYQPLPANVRDIYDQSKYQKSKAYFVENTWFSLVKNTVNFILLIALFVGGFFPWVADIALAITANPLAQTFVFFSILLILNTLLNGPFNYYKTFSIETRYGFNKMTKTLFFKDMFKNILLSALLISGIAVLLQALLGWLGTNFVFGAWIALSVVLVILFALNTKVFIKLFNRLTPLPDGDLKSAIVNLANKTGFKAKAIYTMDASKRSSKLNAFFSGFGPIREIALFDTLIAKLKQEEILAVLAHEIGHAKHFDELRLVLQNILIFGLYAIVINFTVSNGDLASAFGFSGAFFGFGLIVFTILIEPLDFLLGIPVNYLSRRAEFAADHFAVKQGYQKAMLSALKTLVTENYGNLTPHPLQVLLTYSHPPMSLRLAAIEAIKR
jgi:STE24 endopeptidase